MAELPANNPPPVEARVTQKGFDGFSLEKVMCAVCGCKNEIELWDLHEHCILHRSCIGRSTLSLRPSECDCLQDGMTPFMLGADLVNDDSTADSRQGSSEDELDPPTPSASLAPKEKKRKKETKEPKKSKKKSDSQLELQSEVTQQELVLTPAMIAMIASAVKAMTPIEQTEPQEYYEEYNTDSDWRQPADWEADPSASSSTQPHWEEKSYEKEANILHQDSLPLTNSLSEMKASKISSSNRTKSSLWTESAATGLFETNLQHHVQLISLQESLRLLGESQRKERDHIYKLTEHSLAQYPKTEIGLPSSFDLHYRDSNTACHVLDDSDEEDNEGEFLNVPLEEEADSD